MIWHRGFVICPDSDLTAVRALLEAQTNVAPLAALNDETALMFTSRDIPDLKQRAALVIGVDHGVTNYFKVLSGGFSPLHLVPRLGLTLGLVVERGSIAMKSKEVGRQLKQLGRPSDEGKEEGLSGFRWDLDFRFNDPRFQSAIKSFNEIEEALIQAHEPYRIATFDGWYGAVRGELDEVGDIWGDPIAIVVLKWSEQNGEINEITANDSGFVCDGDDIPDFAWISEL